MPELVRDAHIAEQIVFIDGISGSGKSMLGPILATLQRVERYRLESIYEYIAGLHALGKIDRDAAVVLLRIYADEAIYKLAISREVNLRPKDNTGFLNDIFKWRALRRLFLKDGDAALERMRTDRPILQTNTHEMFRGIEIVLAAYQDRVRVFEMVRHPVFLIKHWFYYVEHYGNDPRDLTLWLKAKDNKSVPWFAEGWEEEFLSCNAMDRSIRSIAFVWAKIDAAYARLTPQQQQQILFIPFERFVVEPMHYVRQFEAQLQTQAGPKLKAALKLQKVPRLVYTAGRGHERHNWQRPEAVATNRSEYEASLSLVEKEASPAAQELLHQLARDYERRFEFSLK